MPLFRLFRTRNPPPADPKPRPAVKLGVDGLIRGQEAPTLPPPRSVWLEGTGILDEAPATETPALPASASTIDRIRFARKHTPCIYAVEAGKEDVDALISAQEWDMVRYCATNGSDKGVQHYAIGRLIELRRFSDLQTAICTAGTEGRRIVERALPALEKFVDLIVQKDHFTSDSDRYGLMNLILEHTTDTEVAKKILSTVSKEGRLSWIHIPIRNESVAILLVDAQAKKGMWGAIHGLFCIPMFVYGYLPHWSYAVRVLDQNVETIIGDQRPSERKFSYGGKNILAYIAENTSSCEVAQKALDELLCMADYNAIKDVAAGADHRIVRYDMMAKALLGRTQEAGSLPRSNAVEIGKYALDKLLEAGQSDTIAEVAGAAKLPEVALYAQTLMQK